MQLIQTVAPEQEPLTLNEVKDFLRILDTEDDVLIGSLITATREHIENVTNRQLEVATFELISPCFVSKLPKGSLIDIVSIQYMDENNTYKTLDASQYYKYSEFGIGRIEYIEIPTTATHKEAVKITFSCGYAKVPEAIKQYMKVKISTLYENREQFVIGASIAEFGSTLIDGLLNPYIIRSM